MELFGYASLIGVGLLLGAMGSGGSILSVPILVYLFSLDVVVASSYALFTVGTTSVIGTALKHRDRFIDFPAVTQLGIPSLLATFCTRKWIVCNLPDVLFMYGSTPITRRAMLLSVFAVVILISSTMVIRARQSGTDESSPRPNALALILAGLGVGFLSGLAGIGGGFLFLPALVLFGGLRFNAAVGSALPIIGMNSFVGFLGGVSSHSVDWIFLIFISMLAALGIFLGDLLTNRFSPHILKRIFGLSAFVLGIWILLKEWMSDF
ncbi:MAG TPA: sulfite exporter TauE/SafE family protein [Chryseolinea sp.]